MSNEERIYDQIFQHDPRNSEHGDLSALLPGLFYALLSFEITLGHFGLFKRRSSPNSVGFWLAVWTATWTRAPKNYVAVLSWNSFSTILTGTHWERLSHWTR